MKVVILAGGFGTRLSEETAIKPKPMVEIGGKPILWHIMKLYSFYGFNEFIICLGYKGYMIKEYFANYFLHESDVEFDFQYGNNLKILNNKSEPWKVTLIDTGENTMTGGRILRIKEYVDHKTFMMTYGDGVGNINIRDLNNYHKKHGKIATITAAYPTARFGILKIGKDNFVEEFKEKPKDDGGKVNAGFFILEPEVFDYIESDHTFFEKEPLEKLVNDKQLVAYIHDGFWMPMDKLSDKIELEKLWNSGKAPWKIWK